MRTFRPQPLASAVVLAVAACSATSGPRAPLEPLPPPALDTAGPLRIAVVYPRTVDSSGAARVVGTIASRDSSFLFGSVGRGDARLTVNGQPIRVQPNGAWLAWLPLPDDTVATFLLEAEAGDRRDRLEILAPLMPRYRHPAVGPWIDSTSLHPTGDRWVRQGESLTLALAAAPGTVVQLRLPSGDVLPFVPVDAARGPSSGHRAFDTGDPAARVRPVSRFEAQWTGRLGPDPGHVLSPAFATESFDSAWAWVEAIEGIDTVRVRWPLRLGVVDRVPRPVVVVHDDTAGTSATDGTLAGRAAPFGTYHWFFPNGTIAEVSGRWNGEVRLQLSARSVAWVDARDVQPLRPGTPPVRGTTQAMRLFPDETSVTLRVPLPGRVPFRVDETDRTLRLTMYGVAADADWIQYSGTDPFVRLIEFRAPAEDETEVAVHLSERVWGYRTRWVNDDLLLEIRRPPPIDREAPLRGRVVALDPGHPPLGATGPTGVYEGDVVLAVGRKAKALLEARGARVIMVRDTPTPVGLGERVRRAEAAGAEILVSIHANALPDGVNPFTNNGTSVYYFHPRSAPLARALNRALVRHFGFRDLGMGRGDLALVRPTWMPAVLTEGLFMMIPEQEAVLASEAGQWRYARGIVEGVHAFLHEYVEQR